MGNKRKLGGAQVSISKKKMKSSTIKRNLDVTEAVGRKKKSKLSKEKLSTTETFEDKLARTDPEFLKFLKEEGNSELLECSADDMSVSSSSDDDDDDVDKSDDDVEPDDVDDDVEPDDISADAEETVKMPKSKKVVTLKMIRHWSHVLQSKSPMNVLGDVIEAFKAALQQTGKVDDTACRYKVIGSAEFNAVVQTCIQDLVPALLRHLNLPPSKDPSKPTLPSASPRWKKVRVHVRSYLLDVIQLLSSVGSNQVVRSLLKHVLDLVIFYAFYPKLTKTLIKKLVEIWSECECERNRLIAFCCIHRILRITPESILERTLKLLYGAYVKNTKFTSPTVLPMIQVMQRSLVEIGRLNVALTYKYAFVYIRQLAIHLRNALNVKKKETTQTVYNWQFIYSMTLWTEMIRELYLDESMQSLVYPLTQIIIGTIKLVPTAQYYPLRFLCVRELNKLSSSTSVYIPVLPFLTEVLEQMDVQRKVHSTADKQFNFFCILKFTKGQLHTKAFRDGVIDQVYELIFEHLNIYSHTIGFPELCLPALLQLRKFVKMCKIPAYTRKMKELIGKITETSSAMTERRQAAALNLADLNAVKTWESKSRELGTPLSKFYTTWRKLRSQQLQTELLQSKISQPKSAARSRKSDESPDDEFTEEELKVLAGSGSEDESEEEQVETSDAPTRVDNNDTDSDEGDIVEDMALSDSDSDAAQDDDEDEDDEMEDEEDDS